MYILEWKIQYPAKLWIASVEFRKLIVQAHFNGLWKYSRSKATIQKVIKRYKKKCGLESAPKMPPKGNHCSRKDLNNQRSEERPDCFCPIYSAEPSKECFRVNNAAENQRKWLFHHYNIKRNFQTRWEFTTK